MTMMREGRAQRELPSFHGLSPPYVDRCGWQGSCLMIPGYRAVPYTFKDP